MCMQGRGSIQERGRGGGWGGPARGGGEQTNIALLLLFHTFFYKSVSIFFAIFVQILLNFSLAFLQFYNFLMLLSYLDSCQKKILNFVNIWFNCENFNNKKNWSFSGLFSVRIGLHWFVTRPFFDGFIMFVILLSSVALALEDPVKAGHRPA